MEHRSAAEATRAARARYELDVRRGAERLHQGEFVAIDVDSGLVARIAPWRICARQAACRGVRVGSNRLTLCMAAYPTRPMSGLRRS